MRKFLSGFLAGAIIFSAIGAFAVSYVAEPATFKVLVNGEEFNSDPPALVVEGRTYLPLRAMGEALGVPVEWNAELNQAEVGTTPVSSEQGNTLFGYKTYDGMSAVIDFGAFCGVEPCISPVVNNEYVYYQYTYGDTVDKLADYIDLMSDNGYNFSLSKGNMQYTYYATNPDASKPNFVITAGLPENYTTLDMYVGILITK